MSGDSAVLVWTVGDCLQTLDKLTTEEDYLPEQIFRMDETLLCVKGLLSIRRSGPGCRAFKDRVTVLLGGQCCRLQIETLCDLAP